MKWCNYTVTTKEYIYEGVWSSTFHAYDIPKLNKIRELVNNTQYSTVLDLGCGDGILSSKALGSSAVIGIDSSGNMMKRAMQKLDHVIIADLDRYIPLRSETIHLCLAVDIIEHIVNTDNFLTEIHRTLTDTGKLILITPNLASLAERFLLLFGYQPQNVEVSAIRKFGSIRKTPPVGHVRGFTWPALREMLQYYGFRIDEFTVTTYYTGLLKAMDLVVGRLKKTYASLLVVVCEKNNQ